MFAQLKTYPAIRIDDLAFAFISDENGQAIARVQGKTVEDVNKYTNLFVHAPELLSALEKTLDGYLAQMHSEYDGRVRWNEHENDIVVSARLIIAQAKGVC